MRNHNEVLCRMNLDLDGILHVTAIEKRSGLSKHITIARALAAKSDAEIAAARKRLEAVYATRQDDEELEEEWDENGGTVEIAGEGDTETIPVLALTSSANEGPWGAAVTEARQIVERSRKLLDRIHEEDQEEVIDVNQAIESAIEAQDSTALDNALHQMRELLFFIEGRS